MNHSLSMDLPCAHVPAVRDLAEQFNDTYRALGISVHDYEDHDRAHLVNVRLSGTIGFADRTDLDNCIDFLAQFGMFLASAEAVTLGDGRNTWSYWIGPGAAELNSLADLIDDLGNMSHDSLRQLRTRIDAILNA